MRLQTVSENASVKLEGHEQALIDSAAPDFSEPPDGGLEAWLVVAGAVSIFFACLGFLNSFGVFQEYYMTHQLRDSTPDDVSWIGSSAVFLQAAAGAFAGPIFDRYGAWVCATSHADTPSKLMLPQTIRPAAVGCIFAVMMISLCKRYWQFMLAQGILNGLLMALLQFPALGAVMQFFGKRRAAAIGITVSGSSLGGVVMPIVLSKLLNDSSLGFGWSVRIVGFIMAPFLLFSVFTVKSRLPPRTTSFFVPSMFRNKRFFILTTALLFQLIGTMTVLFYIPSYAVARGVEPTLASYLLAIANASSIFGRIIPGILADKYGRVNIFALAGIASGIEILCWNKATTQTGLIVFVVVYGFTSGAVLSGAAAALSTCTSDTKDVTTYFGFGFGLSSVALLVGPPASGAMIAQYGGYSQFVIFCGVTALVGGLIAVAAKFVKS
jgi:MFS family permease